MTKPNIILATTSRSRIDAFTMLGIPFVAEGSSVDEYFEGRPNEPEALVRHLAQLKAEAVASRHTEPSIVIGLDSIVWFEGKVLEKPASRDAAFARLRALSGHHHQFYTAVHMIGIATEGPQVLSRVVVTDAEMRTISDAEIHRYLDQDPNVLVYAPGYDPLETYGATFIKDIRGSYNNTLRGIPLEAIVEMLGEFGVVF